MGSNRGDDASDCVDIKLILQLTLLVLMISTLFGCDGGFCTNVANASFLFGKFSPTTKTNSL